MMPNRHARQDYRSRCDTCIIFNNAAYHLLARRGWIIRKNDIGQDPHIAADFRFLADEDIRLKADIIPDFAVALYLTECANLKILTRPRVFPHCYMMPRYQLGAERR